MKATLYDALGIAPTSSDEDVRAALRGLIRKYYAKTRDGQGNVEEALRFINHASRILGDHDRRQRYDHDLAGSAESEVLGERTGGRELLLGDDAYTEVGTVSAPGETAVEDPLDTGLPGAAPDEPPMHHPGLTQRVAPFVHSPWVTIGLCGAFAAFIVAAVILVTPPDAVVVGREVLGWLTATLLVLVGVYAAVHGIVKLRRRHSIARSGLVPQTDLAILNWRRERSVFLGTNQPQEDASWIFQLRMAELERAKAGRTSEPRPWHRLAARLFDYALWGLMLALLLTQLRATGAVSAKTAYWLAHPLIAPSLISLSWVPLEALLVAAVGTTPGKWLFGIYLQLSISDAYARLDTRAQLARGLRRALRVWIEGVGCGFPLVAPILVAIAYEKLAENQETDWDFALDCLVTHGPAGVLNSITGVCGIAAMAWLYGIAWHQPTADTIGWTRTTIAGSLPSLSTFMRVLDGSGRAVEALFPSHAGTRALAATSRPGAPVPVQAQREVSVATASPSVGDDGFEAMLAARRARVVALKADGPQMLAARDYPRAAELCRAWADLDLANPEAWRCLGDAEQGLGHYQEALNAFRKAKQHAPEDRTLDASIENAERGIIHQFLDRYSH
ncbi:MAG TPA: DnaJ domain-containing protein [Casimicrobiaceae bacterium]